MFLRLKKYLFNLTHPVLGEVWELHRVTQEQSENKEQQDFEITPERFEKLIVQYKSKDWHFISVNELADRINNKQIKGKFVVITFDDGYEDNYQNALPILEKHNIPFCIFITKNYIEQGYPPYKMLSEKQIKELSLHPLCTIGSHTISHPMLSKLTEQQQEDEITGCKQWLENLLNKKIDIFAFPFGSYNKSTLLILQKSGITLSFAGWGGPIRTDKEYNLLKIPRIIIAENGMYN